MKKLSKYTKNQENVPGRANKSIKIFCAGQHQEKIKSSIWGIEHVFNEVLEDKNQSSDKKKEKNEK